MAPLEIDTYRPDLNKWVHIGEVKPGDRPGSIAQNNPDGTRDIYIFECAKDDSSSTVYRSKSGVDFTKGQLREIISERTNWQVIKIIKKSEEPSTLNIKTDISSQRRLIRFSHR